MKYDLELQDRIYSDVLQLPEKYYIEPLKDDLKVKYNLDDCQAFDFSCEVITAAMIEHSGINYNSQNSNYYRRLSDDDIKSYLSINYEKLFWRPVHVRPQYDSGEQYDCKKWAEEEAYCIPNGYMYDKMAEPISEKYGYSKELSERIAIEMIAASKMLRDGYVCDEDIYMSEMSTKEINKYLKNMEYRNTYITKEPLVISSEYKTYCRCGGIMKYDTDSYKDDVFVSKNKYIPQSSYSTIECTCEKCGRKELHYFQYIPLHCYNNKCNIKDFTIFNGFKPVDDSHIMYFYQCNICKSYYSVEVEVEPRLRECLIKGEEGDS